MDESKYYKKESNLTDGCYELIHSSENDVKHFFRVAIESPFSLNRKMVR